MAEAGAQPEGDDPAVGQAPDVVADGDTRDQGEAGGQEQLATLEEPAPEENPITVSARHAPQEIVAAILQALDQGNPPTP